MKGRKKRIYKTLQEPELSMMMDFIYKDFWYRMKKLNNTAAGDCAHDALNHVVIIDKGECHFRFQDTLALIKECLANHCTYSIRKLCKKMQGMLNKMLIFKSNCLTNM